MTTYASVGVRRIQTHLARTRSLWGRRGASDQLWDLTQLPESENGATSADTAADEHPKPRHHQGHGALVASVLKEHPGVEVNREALDIDGEVPIQGADTEAVWQAARQLVRRIQERQPAVEVVIQLWADQPSYAATLARDPEELEEYLPAVREYPPVRTCDECQTDGVSDVIGKEAPVGLQGKSLCRDCFHRTTTGRRKSLRFATERQRKVLEEGGELVDDPTPWDVAGSRQRPPGLRVEAGLLFALNQDREPHLTYLGGFPDLARVPALKRPDGPGGQADAGEIRRRTYEDNHTALVFADANGLGGIFAALRRRAADSGEAMKQLKSLSAGLKQATWEALVSATKQVTGPGDERLPVIAHLLGGDDLLVSLPATRTWPFVRALMTGLQTEFEKRVYPYVPDGFTRPSVSAAVVVSRAVFPFGLQVDLSERLLKEAKQYGRGADWMITWQDVTADGPGSVSRTPWRWSEMEDRTAALDHLVQMTGSAVGALRSDLSQEDLVGAALKLEHRAARLAPVRELLDWLQVTDPGAKDVLLLRDLLVLGRWWR